MDAPPIQFLRAFDAAARHASFKRAAEEIHVTPSAVSQQIKALEDQLGVELFHRFPRGVRLTEDGAAFHRVASETLDAYRRGVEGFLQTRARRPLRLSTLPFVAYEVLIPALPRLRELHPKLDLRLETSLSPVDLARGDADLAIRIGRGPYPGLARETLADATGGLVCAPSLLTARGTLRASAVRETYLLLLPSLEKRVRERLTKAGLGEWLPERDLVLDGFLATLRAAERGLGVAVGVFPVARPWIESGRLVAPLDARFPLPERFHLLTREGERDRPGVAAVREWVREAFRALTTP